MAVSRTLRLPVTALATAVLVACAGPANPPTPMPTATPAATPTPLSTATPRPSPAPTVAPTAAGPTPPEVALVPVVAGLDAPLDIAVRPEDPDALYVLEQAGRIRVVRDGRLVEQPVLDIAGVVTAGGEQGLLGLAFHPDPDDDRVFVYYTGLDGSQVVASFEVGGDGEADPGSEVVLMRMEDEFGNHNGGALAFGPDGYLYIGTGDGGGGGDPLDSGRRLDTLLAKVLRVDVDTRAADDGPAYAIPADNPFIDVDGARPEIWLTGLRNPWRMRFDRATGDLWIGDVGQGEREEIDRAPAGVGGLDFGWNVMEGFACYRDPGTDCATPDLTLPVTDYGHDQGCSVTGGTVYRGAAMPDLVGWYVFGDYCSGRVWALDAVAPADGPVEPVLILDSGRSISAIAEDADGELIVTDLGSGDVFRIGRAAT